MDFVDDVYLVGALGGSNLTFSLRSRTSLMPRFDAPSISMTSTLEPSLMDRQLSQRPHGSGVGPSRAVKPLAKRRATSFFPSRGDRQIDRNGLSFHSSRHCLRSVRHGAVRPHRKRSGDATFGTGIGSPLHPPPVPSISGLSSLTSICYPCLSLATKKGRAPAFDQPFQALPRQLAPIRRPCGTQGAPLTAASFRT